MRGLLLTATAAAALVAAGCGSGEDATVLQEGKPVATSRSLTPLVHLFGDPVVARVDLLVDTEQFDPDGIRLVPNLDPFELEGEPSRVTRKLGRYAHIRWELTYRCVVYECLQEVGGGPPQMLPGGIPPPNTGQGGFADRKSFRIKAARVMYDAPGTTQPKLVTQITWPSIQNASRLNMSDTNVTGIGYPFEASVTPLPVATTRSPLAVAGGLALAALALLALPAALVIRALRRREPPPPEPEPELTPLERALRLVAWSRERPDGERRQALELLAHELDGDGRALDARRLAWSPSTPAPEEMDELVESVQEPS